MTRAETLKVFKAWAIDRPGKPVAAILALIDQGSEEIAAEQALKYLTRRKRHPAALVRWLEEVVD